ncbi:hypothetical protein NDI45_26380, partial [Leptolyngbya sp. GB1-A1]
VKLEYLFDCAFSPIRQYGQSDSAVMSHLLDAIALIAYHAETPEQKRALRHHAEMILRGSQQGLSEEWDRQMIEERYQAVLETLDQRQY